MDSKFIQEAVQKWLFECDHIYQACNFSGCYFKEADVLAITRSYIVTEVEVKISVSDYRADFKKTVKHDFFSNPTVQKTDRFPNRFYYAVPKDMIKNTPIYAGLLFVDENGNVEEIKSAPYIHKQKATDKLMVRLLENLTSKIIWGCQYMTHKNRIATEKFNQYKAEQKVWSDKIIELGRQRRLNNG